MCVTCSTTQATFDYDSMVQVLRKKSASIRGPLFTTSFENLFTIYREAIPPVERPGYFCHSCRDFLNAYGSLVTINDDGEMSSLFWQKEFFPTSLHYIVGELNAAVLRGRVTGVFLTDTPNLGVMRHPKRGSGGTWEHLAVQLGNGMVFKAPLRNASQAMAEKLEDKKMLAAGLAEFSAEVVKTAKGILNSNTLYRTEACLGVAKWLDDLHTRLAAAKNSKVKENILWKAVATAPVGFCHVKSSMIGTLLEDIQSGKPIEVVRAKYADKMHPLKYQRPTAAPTEGQLVVAEKVMAKLRAEGALKRRFAKLEDVTLTWRPSSILVEATKGRLFDSLRAPKQTEIQTHTVTRRTWEKFSTVDLPNIMKLELYVQGRDRFGAFVTADDVHAPNLTQWDNPVTWYNYAGNSTPRAWNLNPGYVPVTGIALAPYMWAKSPIMGNRSKMLMLVLEGCYDMAYSEGGGFFPEQLRSEYHEIRHTLEAYAKQSAILGKTDATACGLLLSEGSNWEVKLRATTRDGIVSEFILDRWD